MGVKTPTAYYWTYGFNLFLTWEYRWNHTDDVQTEGPVLSFVCLFTCCYNYAKLCLAIPWYFSDKVIEFVEVYEKNDEVMTKKKNNCECNYTHGVQWRLIWLTNNIHTKNWGWGSGVQVGMGRMGGPDCNHCIIWLVSYKHTSRETNTNIKQEILFLTSKGHKKVKIQSTCMLLRPVSYNFMDYDFCMTSIM